MIYSLKDSEETIKNKVRQDFFADYDGTQCFDNIDFSVAVREEGTFVLPEREYLLWAESKAGNKHSLFDSLVQLILTIGKARTLDNALPPHFLGAFDAEKIAFIPFSAVMQVFALNDFNWNVTPSDHASKEFKLLHQLVKQQIQEHAAQEVMEAGKAVWHYYLHHQSDQLYAAQPDINASFYDIRRFFQGTDAKGKMNTDSNDLTYMALLRDLRAKQKALAAQITPKVYQYGFLK